MSRIFKIALINPRVESYSGTMPPLGLLYIAALLREKGFCIKVFDFYPYDDRDLPELLDYQPDVIGMTVLTDYLPRAKHLAGIIRQRLNKALFIIGGVHITALPQESMSDFCADIGVIGEGEDTMVEICEKLVNDADWRDTPGIIYPTKDGFLVRTSPRVYIENLDRLPFPARDLINFQDYLFPPGIIRGYWSERSTTVMTSRGCPFSCIWCGSQCTFGRKVRYRGINNVMLELESLIEQYAVDSVWFVDDTFTLRKDRVLEFCEQIKKRNIRLSWGCQAHVKTADLEMFRRMKKRGLVQLDFGVESGSQRVLNYLKKDSDINLIKRAFTLAKKAGIRTCATFMFGSPGEEKEDVEATFRLAREIEPDFTSSFFITPYPGTELMDMVKQKGWELIDDRHDRGLKRRPMLLIHFSEQDLFAIRKDFQKMFVLRNFSNCILDFRYLCKGVTILLRYPGGISRGIEAFLKTRVFDDFLFAFLIYYVSRRLKKEGKCGSDN